MKKVTGIGGVFFKCRDPKAMKEWYGEHLGLITDDYGGAFQWRQYDQPEKSGYTAWSPFRRDSDYFAPSEKDFMFNYRVADLDALLAELRKAGISIIGEVQVFDYGRFAHILDPEGNKIELWEPRDEAFDDYYQGKVNR
ncbi:MAG: VOC family protein [Bacteroidota bacterium]